MIDQSFSAVMPVRVSTTPSPIRALIIDLGTNSFHGVIVDAHANGSFQLLDRRKELVGFGEMGLSKHWLSEEAIARGLDALKRFRLLGEGWGVEDHLAYATSAIREARNGGDFIDRVRHEIGFDIRTISGEREAGLIYEGVRIAIDMPEPCVIVDIGGGSTEFVVATSNESVFETSLKLGAARLTEKFISSDPLESRQLERLKSSLAMELDQVFAVCRGHGTRTLVGSSGALENLAQVCVSRFGDPNLTIFQQSVSAEQLGIVCADLVASDRQKRESVAGLEAKRIDQIVAAAVLIQILLEHAPIERFVVSPNALREGMVVHFIRLNHERLEQLAPYGDVRRRSVNELGFRCQWEVRHSHKVADLATAIFDACVELHGFGAAERELLEYAALLHDVGYHISRSNHHKHSAYIIANADLNGFMPDEIATMALIARFHAGSLPNLDHAAIRDLPSNQRARVLRLASFLRIAEGLDRSHFQNVTSMTITLAGDRLLVEIETESDPELDFWGGHRGADLFEKVFDLPVEIRLLSREETSA